MIGCAANPAATVKWHTWYLFATRDLHIDTTRITCTVQGLRERKEGKEKEEIIFVVTKELAADRVTTYWYVLIMLAGRRRFDTHALHKTLKM